MGREVLQLPLHSNQTTRVNFGRHLIRSNLFLSNDSDNALNGSLSNHGGNTHSLAPTFSLSSLKFGKRKVALRWKCGSLEMLRNRMANWGTYAEIGTFVLFEIDNRGVVI
ncbi:hypothetical protein CDAR_477371 [Caerostris darwini]|uniref:Uncharacterized protein n=1 Tax=Caerostris darwini TaxID=1538125 RepID=A0AAV4TQV1_9ARAC|nr:hypothetical protein CDAR_477371 [Caerostris darwini]